MIAYGLSPLRLSSARLIAALRADDAGRDGEVEAERVADGEHPLTDARASRRHRSASVGQVLLVDLDDGDVGRRIAADDLRLELALVVQRDRHLVGVGDDVVVREDVAVVRDDEAGAARLFGLRRTAAVVELPEEIFDARRETLAATAAGNALLRRARFLRSARSRWRRRLGARDRRSPRTPTPFRRPRLSATGAGLVGVPRACAQPKCVRSKPDAKTRPHRKATTIAAPKRAREYLVDIWRTYLMKD